MRMPRVGGFDGVGSSVHLENEIDDVRERDVMNVRSLIVTPADVIADLILGDAFKGIVQGFHTSLSCLAKRFQRIVSELHMSAHRSIRSIDLKDVASVRNGSVLMAHGF